MSKRPSERPASKNWTFTDLALVSVAFLFLTGLILPFPILWVIAGLISFGVVAAFGMRLIQRLNSTIRQQT
jgi:hypothetical protein